MRDIANQMLMKWARMGNGHTVLLTDDFTKFTLDTIALCTMDYRFNSFYRDELHPFVDAMVTYLSHSGELSTRPWIVNMLLPRMATEKLNAKILLDKTGQQIIEERRQNPKPGKDLVNIMLYDADPKTGKTMRDSLIRETMIAFLIAGHETTSSLLSFTCSNLVSYPKVFLKARQEVDKVVGRGRVEPHHLKELKYMSAILRETLRLTPTVPSLAKRLNPDLNKKGTTIGDGKYYVGPNDRIDIILTKAQRDTSFFGEDAHEFKPERMMDENSKFADFMKAWRPFGNGSRSCIGQPFAWQESLMIMAMILQNFDFNYSDPGYQMRIQEVLTIKPDNLYVALRLREGVTISTVEKRLFSGDQAEEVEASQQVQKLDDGKEPDLMVLFGSNTGSCQSLAQKLATRISSSTGKNVAVRELDAVAGSVRDCPIIVVTATYEGQPPDNAGRFVAWLEGLNGGELSGLKYAVFGLGNKNWQSTYQRIPRLIDTKMEAHGAQRLANLSAIDVTENSIMDELEAWFEGCLQKPLREALGIKESDQDGVEEADAEIMTGQRATSISNGMVVGKVLHAKLLTTPGHQPEKRHVEIQLPSGLTYECGDYLAVLPLNGRALVRKIMAHWNLPWDSTIVLKSRSFAPLLTDVPLSIFDILTGYFELAQPPSRRTLEICRSYASGATSEHLNYLIEQYESAIIESRMSFFDVLLEYPDIGMPFPTFLTLLPPLRPRQYSISSSPLVSPNTCTLTYGVLKVDTEDSRPLFQGVASNYLASLNRNDTLQISIRQTATANKACAFRLPLQQSTPLIMIGAGTGLAPFRGFIQERAKIIELNKETNLGRAVLFMGCRSATEDRLYSREMHEWEMLGAIEVRYAFSREPEKSDGCKYVSDRLYKDQELVTELWEAGARVYVCGGRKLAESTEGAFTRMIEDYVAREGGGAEMLEEEKRAFLEDCNQRAAADIFD